MTNDKIIFVTGATGNQGGAVARNLSLHGFHVKALTRNPQSAKAQQLKNLNIELIQGDLNHTDSYHSHMKDVYGVFSVQTFENGIQKEIDQGIALATLAEESGVKHFIYSSVLGANLNTGIPHFESKFKIENHIRQLDLPFTIIRPALLFENFLIPQVNKRILKGKLEQPIIGDKTLQYIAAADIGQTAVKIFQNPEFYSGKTLALATEHISLRDIAGVFSEVLGKKVEYRKLPMPITRIFLGKNLYLMFKWTNEKGIFYQEDVEFTRKEIPEFLNLRNWIAINFN